MTFDEAVVQIELGGLSHVNDGLVDDDFALGVVNELRETYAKPVEMTREQKDYIDEIKGYDMTFVYLWYSRRRLYTGLSQSEVMRAWLHPELIKVVGNG